MRKGNQAMNHVKFQIANRRLERRVTAPPQSAIQNPQSAIQNPKSKTRPAFTLTELLIVMLIISIMAGMTLAVVSGATNMAREQRTRAIISKLDQLIMERFDGYRTRAVPMNLTIRQQYMGSPFLAAQIRLYALRDLMRMEFPERITDIIDTSNNSLRQPNYAMLGIRPSSLQNSYYRTAFRMTNGNLANWTAEHQYSECLYLIISTMQDGDKNALDFFLPEEIGDTDEDGMKEILDAWGEPIVFLRWAPGYVTNPWDATRASMLTTQTRPMLDASNNIVPYTPDPYDPIKADPSWQGANNLVNFPFDLRPLQVSAGQDKALGLIVNDYDPNNPSTTIQLVYTSPPQPYMSLPNATGRRIGEPFSASAEYADNITNHYQQTP